MNLMSSNSSSRAERMLNLVVRPDTRSPLPDGDLKIGHPKSFNHPREWRALHHAVIHSGSTAYDRENAVLAADRDSRVSG